MCNAEYIYNCIREYTGNKTCSLCYLHNPCKNNYCCNVQKRPVIDFDDVKRIWSEAEQKPSPSSVDALTFGDKLFFVELKGWKKFLENQKILRKEIITDKDKEVLNKKIENKAESYNYQKKLLDSINICENISNVSNIINNIPLAFILVTDINPQTKPLETFTEQLFMLANTSTNWEKVCKDTMYKHLNNQIKNIQTYFIYCQEFDNFINKL